MVTVVGLGFVGLTTALGLAEYGHTVYGVETDLDRLATIQSGRLPFLEPGLGDALAGILFPQRSCVRRWSAVKLFSTVSALPAGRTARRI